MGLAAGALSAHALSAAGVDGFTCAAWAVTTGGFSLLCDLDTPRSRAARLWGPMLMPLAATVRIVSGQHRYGSTHDVAYALPAVFAVVAVWQLLGALWPIAMWPLLAVVFGLAFVACDPLLPGDQENPALNCLCSLAAGYGLTHVVGSMPVWLLPLSAVLGVAVHVFGDSLTPLGVPRPGTSRRDPGPSDVPAYRWGLRCVDTSTPEGERTESRLYSGSWVVVAACVVLPWLTG